VSGKDKQDTLKRGAFLDTAVYSIAIRLGRVQPEPLLTASGAERNKKVTVPLKEVRRMLTRYIAEWRCVLSGGSINGEKQVSIDWKKVVEVRTILVASRIVRTW
jgi:hypothetical protein